MGVLGTAYQSSRTGDPSPCSPWQALLGQRLRLQETSLAPFALPTVSLLPAITLGLPAPARVSGWGTLPPLRASPASFLPVCYCLTLFFPSSPGILSSSDFLPFFQADGDRRTHSTLGPRGPVLGNPHTPLFLHHGLEPEATGTLPSRLQPILLLDPSVSHAPLWTGES